MFSLHWCPLWVCCGIADRFFFILKPSHIFLFWFVDFYLTWFELYYCVRINIIEALHICDLRCLKSNAMYVILLPNFSMRADTLHHGLFCIIVPPGEFLKMKRRRIIMIVCYQITLDTTMTDQIHSCMNPGFYLHWRCFDALILPASLLKSIIS